MKRILFVTLCFSVLSIVSLAQVSETFDIATFHPPKGWKKHLSKDSVQFVTGDKATGAYCIITLAGSLPGPGNSKENFDTAWESIVKGTVNVSVAPQKFPSNNPEDWALEGGFAPFEKDGKKGVVLLYTISGYGKMVNVMILSNTQAYEQNITAFVESISLKKPVPKKSGVVKKELPPRTDNQARGRIFKARR